MSQETSRMDPRPPDEIPVDPPELPQKITYERLGREAKKIWESKTFWGIVVVVGSGILQLAGIEVDLTPLADGGSIVELVQIIGAVVTAWGIRTAEKPIETKGERKARGTE